jgi:hypothetical protein
MEEGVWLGLNLGLGFLLLLPLLTLHGVLGRVERSIMVFLFFLAADLLARSTWREAK